MTDEQTCARCARPIRSGQSTRFVRGPAGSSPRIEHFTCPTVSLPDRGQPPPPRPDRPGPPGRRR